MDESVGRSIGRYVLFDKIASGGMASVHLGRLIGPVGFARTVAIKRLHSHIARDPQFVTMFLDEARLAARIHHPNVVLTLDVVALEGEVFLVLEHVQGQSLAKLCRAAAAVKQRVPVSVGLSLITGLLSGLHAAHEARGERGEPLEIVHRDVSPQNILVGVDGVARVLDFGVAKAANRLHESTSEGRLKGKLAYMAPEQISGKKVDRRTDIFAASVVAWEVLTGRRLFSREEPAATVSAVLQESIPSPSSARASLPQELDAIVLRGLERDPTRRFQSAEEMATELERVGRLATPREVGAWVRGLAADAIAERADQVAQIEGMTPSHSGLSLPGGTPSLAPEVLAASLNGEPSGDQQRSNITDISFVTSKHNPWRSPLVWVVAGAALVLFAGGGVLLGRRLDRAPTTGVASLTPGAPPVPSGASSHSLTPATSPGPSPAASHSVAAAPALDAGAPATVTGLEAGGARKASATGHSHYPRSRRVRKRSGCATVPARCKPPWTIDSSGGKRFKPDCVQYLNCL